MKSGQYDNMYAPSVRMLFDGKKKDDKPAEEKAAGDKNQANMWWTKKTQNKKN